VSTREEELAALIEEQRQDDTPFIQPDQNVVLYLDSLENGQMWRQTSRRDRGCTIHGVSSLVPSGGCKACANERRRRRHATDPEYRERMNARVKQYHRDHPERNAKRREQYANDPEYRKQQLVRSKRNKKDPEYRKRENARRRERYQNDPEYRARCQASDKRAYAKRQAKIAEGYRRLARDIEAAE
jgi:hypothetical protein